MKRGDTLLITSGTVIGVGLGGFVDGILLHQILQWHEMISSVVPPVDVVSIKLNMLYDGLFHAMMWITTFVGVLILVSAAGAPHGLPVARTFGGSLLVGWGMFNIIEGLIDHQLLGLHHVHPGAGQLAWDVGFLVVSAILVTIGALVLVRSVATARFRPVT
ncbi:MAG: hypothetical protein K0S65_2221 [Labilithrix sp.]|nr:hypothetical protein [Labilithrix sp.]